MLHHAGQCIVMGGGYRAIWGEVDDALGPRGFSGGEAR